jgi:hypothetical protein
MRFITLMLCLAATCVVAAPAMAAETGSFAAGYDETGVLNNIDQGGSLPPVVPGDNENTGDLPTGEVRPTVDAGVDDDLEPVASTPKVTPVRAVESGADNVASLPFTGLDVGFVLAAGLALLATGLVVRRTTHSAS